MTIPLDVVEIYPKIFVYKNLYKDINFTYKLLEDSDGQDGLFSSSLRQVIRVVAMFVVEVIKAYEKENKRK